jgi:hypothetical protein
MDRLIQVDRERLAAEMHQELEGVLGQVMDAVNAAKDGRLIAESERPVLELMREFQKRVFEKAVQLRVDSTESAFSPSQELPRQDPTQQRAIGGLASDVAGADGPAADAVLRPHRRQSRSG